MKTSSAGRIRIAFSVFAMVVVLFIADWSHAQWAAHYYLGSSPAQAVVQTADGGYAVVGGRDYFAWRARVMRMDESGKPLYESDRR